MPIQDLPPILVSVRRFKARDLKTLEEWMFKHKINSTIPEDGFVTMKNGVPKAIGFLRICEGSIGIVDSIITDPSALSEDRHQCLELLFESLIKHAYNLNIRHLIGFSVDKGTIERSERFGFRKSPYTLMTLELGG